MCTAYLDIFQIHPNPKVCFLGLSSSDYFRTPKKCQNDTVLVFFKFLVFVFHIFSWIIWYCFWRFFRPSERFVTFCRSLERENEVQRSLCLPGFEKVIGLGTWGFCVGGSSQFFDREDRWVHPPCFTRGYQKFRPWKASFLGGELLILGSVAATFVPWKKVESGCISKISFLSIRWFSLEPWLWEKG